MRALSAIIVEHEPLLSGLARLSLAAPPLSGALPGQWIALRQPAALSVIAHPFAVSGITSGGVEVLYQSHDTLAPWLSTLSPGGMLDVLGPWGRPFHVDALARHIVLLGSGDRLVGLLALARALVANGVAVVVLHDAPTAGLLLPPVLLPAAVEYHVATADGSAGAKGAALEALPPLLPWADALYAAVDPARYAALRDLVRSHRLRARRGFATVLAGAPLACYAGACDGCAVPLRGDDYALLCKDGPAFDLLALA